jgi:hypothetical protein
VPAGGKHVDLAGNVGVALAEDHEGIQHGVAPVRLDLPRRDRQKVTTKKVYAQACAEKGLPEALRVEHPAMPVASVHVVEGVLGFEHPHDHAGLAVQGAGVGHRRKELSTGASQPLASFRMATGSSTCSSMAHHDGAELPVRPVFLEQGLTTSTSGNRADSDGQKASAPSTQVIRRRGLEQLGHQPFGRPSSARRLAQESPRTQKALAGACGAGPQGINRARGNAIKNLFFRPAISFPLFMSVSESHATDPPRSALPFRTFSPRERCVGNILTGFS